MTEHVVLLKFVVKLGFETKLHLGKVMWTSVISYMLL